MQKYTKIYLDAFGYGEQDYTPSEISENRAVDINHIDNRGMGGDPKGEKDRIENLMALTRKEHDEFGDKNEHMSFLYLKHKEFMILHGVKFDEKFINDKIQKFNMYINQ